MKLLILAIITLFFSIGIWTLPHYGINWDTINHLPRGQAYLHFFLTGKKDYSDLEKWRHYFQNPNSLTIKTDLPQNQIPKRSYYQTDAANFNFFMEHDGSGHPPLSDILSSVFNLVLFQKLQLINDIDSYRVYSIFLAASLVGLIFYWVSKVYSKAAGLIAALVLSVYPLFWSEAHFNNEKDIPEAVYWSFFLFAIWKAMIEKSLKWFLLAGMFFGLALGTKFNILFAIFVFLPWMLIHLKSHIQWKNLKTIINKNVKLILYFLSIPLIGGVIFIGTWPFLWPDPLSRIIDVFKFYKNIGITLNRDPRFLGPLGTNIYPLQWITYTTPTIILLLFIIGLIFIIKNLKREKNYTSILFLLWLAVPIVRATWPGATIYGGIRQIMEYIPALAIIAGVGGMFIYNLLVRVFSKIKIPQREILAIILIMISFLPFIFKLVSIHPNENVYFNELIGGLSGAKNRDLPSWGNSFGAAYRQGFDWINKNAEVGANVVFAHELSVNFPNIWIRSDLNFNNQQRSGELRKSEYAITLIYDGALNNSYYDSYLEKFLIPVHEIKVDGVSILKIWKNDVAHTRSQFLKEEQVTNVKIEKDSQRVRLDLNNIYTVSRVEVKFENQDCVPLKTAYSQISIDGKNWQVLPGTMPNEDWNAFQYGAQPVGDKFVEPFSANKARFIEYIVSPSDACLGQFRSVRAFYLPNAF